MRQSTFPVIIPKDTSSFIYALTGDYHTMIFEFCHSLNLAMGIRAQKTQFFKILAYLSSMFWEWLGGRREGYCYLMK